VHLATVAVFAQPSNRPTQPPRDTPAGARQGIHVPKGRISGVVRTADTGRPVRRARVSIVAPQLPEGRGALTDDNGAFVFEAVPEGRYTLTVSKAGFISLSYGQRRPLQAGTPLQLADGQELKGIEFRLPRGGVIAGHIYDDAGDPLPGANVRIMRYQYAQGNRELVSAGTSQTDDRGYYRVWGLNPGQYYVSAVTRNFNARGPDGRGAPPAPSPGNVQRAPEQVGYAATFYPGVPSVAEARPVTVGVGGEAAEIDFNLLLVRTSRISGHVTGPDGTATTAGNVSLIPEVSQGGRGGTNLGGRIEWDGAFTIANVPPGRYTLRARADDTVVPHYAVQPLTVSELDVPDLIVVLSPGGSIGGTVTFQNSRSTRVPDLTQLRITAPAADSANTGSNPTARVDREGRFTIEGVAAGPHWIRAQGPLRGWMLKSVVVDGRDVIDTPVEVRSGGQLAGATLVFTDTLSEVNGTVSDNRGTPFTEYTVLAFSADPALWRAQTRHIMTARPDQNGRYQLRGLPPGDYFLATVDPAEQGEWFEPSFLEAHRAGATALSLSEGATRTHDFTVSR
jgi:hypothetical protein